MENRSVLGSALVAMTLLVVIGAIAVAGALRYSEAELENLLGVLSPLLGIVTGAFVTYFFTRQSAQTVVDTARTSADQANMQLLQAQEQVTAEQRAHAQALAETQRQSVAAQEAHAQALADIAELTARTRVLHNAVTAMAAALPERQVKTLAPVQEALALAGAPAQHHVMNGAGRG